MKRMTNDTNTLCTVTTSFLVVLDSENASSKNNGDWNSDVTFNFESPIVKPPNSFIMSMCVQQFTAANSIYNINETNNYIHITENISNIDIPYDFYIPYGNYNVNTFTAKFCQTLADYTDDRFSLSFNPLNNKFVIINSTYTFTILSDSTINNVMGLIIGATQASTSTVLICPYSCNFNGTQSINIMIKNLQTPNIDSFHKSNAHVIQSVSIDPSAAQIYYEKSNDYSFKVSEHVFDHLQVQICNGTNKLVNFNNQDWNMTLLFTIMYDVNRFDHENTFYSILEYGYNV
jgi:hypothetical protein